MTTKKELLEKVETLERQIQHLYSELQKQVDGVYNHIRIRELEKENEELRNKSKDSTNNQTK